MKRRCRIVEVAHPGVGGGHPSDGCRVTSLLAEVEYAEPVGDEVQASKEEGLGYSSEPKRIVSPEPTTAGVVEKWAIR